MTRRTGKEGLHQRVIEMDVKKRKEKLNEKEALRPRRKLVEKISKFEDLESEVDYEDCFDDLPADIRKAYINGTWDLE